MLDKFPQILYNNEQIIRNFYFSSQFVDNYIKDNVASFLTYDIQHGDTPESISYDLYGTDKYWYMLLFINNIQDPFYDWVISNEEARDYAIQFTNEEGYQQSGAWDLNDTRQATAYENRIDVIFTQILEDHGQKQLYVPRQDIVAKIYNELVKQFAGFK